MEEEKIEGADLKRIQLEILDVVVSFCESHGIKYWLDFGTMLGAVRHKGYIPWDDDIDISMLRSDYDKFKELFNREHDRYKFCSYETDAKFYYAFGKVLDLDTVLYEPSKESGEKLAVNIDIFPMDSAPDPKTAAKMYKKRNIYNLMDTAKKHRGRAKGNILRRFAVRLLKLFAAFFPRATFVKKIVRNAKKYINSDFRYIGDFSGSVTSFVFDKSVYDDLIDADFEGRKYKIPAKYDDLLTAYFGEYMEFPPECERVSHHRYEAFYVNM